MLGVASERREWRVNGLAGRHGPSSMGVRRAPVGWAAGIVIFSGLLALPLVASAATFPVNIQGFAYAPNPVTIRVGDTVTWTNRDAAQHSARFAGRPSTPILSQGQSGSVTFTTAGTFNYDCAVYGSSMQGTVVVQAVSTPQPTAPPTARPTAPPPTASPTAVRTAPPTAASTAPPAVAPTEAATTPSATPAAVETPTVSASPSAVAVQLTPVPAQTGGGLGPLVIGAAALAVIGLAAIVFFLARRA